MPVQGWDDRIPLYTMGGADPVLLSELHQRRLGASALRLWQYLVDLRGAGDGLLHVSLVQTARTLPMPERTVDRALARLCEAGAALRWRYRELGPNGWVSTLYVRVLGGEVEHKGRQEIWMPHPVAAWCERQPGWGGPRLGRQLEQVGASEATPTAQVPFSAIALQGVTEQDGAPKNLSITVGEQGLFSSRKDAAPRAASLSLMVKGIDQASIPKRANKALTLCAQVKVRNVDAQGLPTGTTGMACQCDPDNPATVDGWVRTLVAAYNTALREVYAAHVPGLRFVRAPGSADEEFASWEGGKVAPRQTLGQRAADPALRRWRVWLAPGKTMPVYPLLQRAARTLHDKGISPVTWCTHVMERSRDYALGKGKGPKPLPMHVVFKCKDNIESPAQRAMFYQERQDTGFTIKPEQVHFEQMYRLRESRHRARGMEHLFGFPLWYAELRKVEIKQGDIDPMIRFPAAGGKR